jgi:hypothetical protein
LIATLTLRQSGDTKCLAGFDETGEGVYVLHKAGKGDWTLHHVELPDMTLALRAILSATQSEAGEIAEAIESTKASLVRSTCKAFDEFRKLAIDYGMTPTARASLQVPIEQPEQENPMVELLARMQGIN